MDGMGVSRHKGWVVLQLVLQPVLQPVLVFWDNEGSDHSIVTEDIAKNNIYKVFLHSIAPTFPHKLFFLFPLP